ncbi:nucleoside hydrolase [Microbacterium cremeum]|uniref:nucleoside hydrolase n=1 Tax=Microbacterium cremeum TaxID=2782169 RepID=UPI001888AD3C|nr:nucleoside hydrolase [Microbacterium cremeum]
MTSIPDVAVTQNARTWTLGTSPWQRIPAIGAPRARVIIDNDFSGDPDDLYQLVHHLLSPNVDIRLVVASHLRDGDPFDSGPDTAENATRVVEDVFARMGLESTDVVTTGSNRPLADRTTPQPAPAVDAIVTEAMRDDDTPLFFVAGGGLTDLASAYLVEPRIAERMTVIWIGGLEHEGLAVPPPDAMPIEYNLLIDVVAGQVVFNDSGLAIWQVPRDVYRQCLVSDAELRLRVAATGPLGRYLYDEVARVVRRATGQGRGPAETYALGDSPLVLLTALRSLFEADSSSSRHVGMPTPAIADNGTYVPAPDARPMRVYTWVDTRLMFEDFYLKLQEFSAWQQSETLYPNQ